MKISRLQEYLEEAIQEHGDIEVYINFGGKDGKINNIEVDTALDQPLQDVQYDFISKDDNKILALWFECK